jgi:hypothetical protein
MTGIAVNAKNAVFGMRKRFESVHLNELLVWNVV